MPPVVLPTLVSLLLVLAWPAMAQTPIQTPIQSPRPDVSAADPRSASALPDWRAAMPSPTASPELPASLDEAIRRWQAAHRAVGEFPRGHADLLRWEQARTGEASPKPTADPLAWPEAWQQIRRQHADQILQPRANVVEQWQARRQWLALERQARRAWVQAITAQARLGLQEERLHAARTAHALGERMARLGHWSRARFIPVQQALAEEQAGLLQARWEARQTLETLAGLMGLWQADAVQALGQRLPAQLQVPAEVQATARAEGQALEQRPDLRWQRDAALRQLQSVSEAQWARWAQALEHTLTAGAPVADRPAAGNVPQWAEGALRGDHALEKALAAQTALQRESAALRRQVRQAWDQLQAALALDRLQHDQLLPLAQAAETETLLRYNGMLQSTWELIDAARARLGAQADALNARQAHWLAHIDWHTLMAGGEIDPPAGVSAGKNPGASGAAKGH